MKENTSSQQRKSLIYIAGFMGSGKSTIGPILANTLGFDFIDIDKFVESKAQKRIVDIFASEGEQAFRTLEQSSLKEVSMRTHCVVSLGGGTIANEENFQLIHDSGVIIYLQLSPEEILQRVHHRTDRPMLTGADGLRLPVQEVQQRVQDLLQRREQFYSRADVVIQTDRKRVGATVDEIVRKLRGLVDT
ncbi:MAG TPA: shikimate kinase [Bacteroidota bacterium]|nr:shikimate kinase [Bacteroidota bacterium]